MLSLRGELHTLENAPLSSTLTRYGLYDLDFDVDTRQVFRRNLRDAFDVDLNDPSDLRAYLVDEHRKSHWRIGHTDQQGNLTYTGSATFVQ